MIDGFGIPWAPVSGNHDYQDGPESVAKAFEILRGGKHCLLDQGDPALGYGNYVVGIEENGRMLHGVILKILTVQKHGPTSKAKRFKSGHS